MKKNNSGPIADLTAETTKLLNEVAGQKDRLQTLANTSESNVKVSKNHADRAGVESLNSFNEAERSKKEATRSMVEADRSQTAANRAELVSGMDTAQELVDLAVTEGFVPVQAQIDAVQANTKLAIVHAPLDNKLSLHAGIGEPVFVTAPPQNIDVAAQTITVDAETVEIPAQNITVGAETVQIPAQSIVVSEKTVNVAAQTVVAPEQLIEVPDIQQIRFSRASKAWLDGVEYGVDEPRYTKDGKLVVEPQRTNMSWLIPNTKHIDDTTDVWGGNSGITVLDVEKYMGFNLYNIDNLPKDGTVYSCSFWIKGDKGLGTMIYIPHTSTQLTFTGDWQYFEFIGVVTRDAGHYFTVQTEANIGCSYTVCGFQFEKSDAPTSYIPTPRTAVTRAADIATINGQNIVTRWENDQQPIDTDTPRLLANGEHNMSADRLVKFERSTSAWLDGVEYAAGEPRYTKDGKLLIEPQTTNFWVNDLYKISQTKNNADVVASDYTHKIFTHDVTLTKVVGLSTDQNDTYPNYQFGYMTIPFVELNRSYYVTFIYKKVEGLVAIEEVASTPRCVSPSFKINSSGLPVLGKYRNTTVLRYTVDSQDFVTVTSLVTVESLVNNATIVGLRFSNVESVSTECIFGIVQVSDHDSSFIPTTTTAVTRAADYAHVISKQAINTPTGLLPTGEHSVEPTAIRSFKRDTSAWLDGVEYPANTPRYLPNGQLLIEPQSTNLLRYSISSGDTTGWQCSCELTKDQNTPWGSPVGIKLTSPADTNNNRGIWVHVGSQNKKGCFSVMLKGEIGGEKVNVGFNVNDPVTLTTDWVRYAFPYSATHNTNLTIYAVNECSFYVYGVQMENDSGHNSTTFIPTTTAVTVTRAADECFVDYQLPPNTYRDLKGFKK